MQVRDVAEIPLRLRQRKSLHMPSGSKSEHLVIVADMSSREGPAHQLSACPLMLNLFCLSEARAAQPRHRVRHCNLDNR
jgi:hypothetical protein